MAENSLISWTDHTFNPWIGCARVSPACDGCYAAHLMGGGRYSRAEWGGPGKGVGTRARTAPSNWAKVRKWNKLASDEPGKTFVFCASLADVFDNAVPPEWRRDLFDLIRDTPNLTWLLLTKRPQNIVKLFCQTLHELDGSFVDDGAVPVSDYWPRNAAIGCTVVTQEEVDRDVPKLLMAKSDLRPAFAFLSMEPLLGRVNLRAVACDLGKPARYGRLDALGDEGIDWVIAGGETDQGAHKARAAHPDWFRSLRDQCGAAGVPFHFKQWGEWQPLSDDPGDTAMTRRGKYADQCTLDGVKHDARP